VKESVPAAFLGTCAKHYAERAVAQCHDCGQLWCADCLVPPISKRQPPRCVDCSLVAAGVRAKGPRRQGMTDMSRAVKKKAIGL